MDIHPPHHPVHTWTDFWIHLGTITVGLLIALGLENVAESFHRHHRMRELERSLKAETQRNQEYIGNNLMMNHYLEEVWHRRLVRAQMISYPGFKALIEDSATAPPVHTGFLPDTAVWDNARQSASAALLPGELAQAYTDNYTWESRAMAAHQATVEQAEATLGFVQSIPGPGAAGEPDLTVMSKDDVKRYSVLVSTLAAKLAQESRVWRAYGAHNHCLLQLGIKDESLMQCMANELQRQ